MCDRLVLNWTPKVHTKTGTMILKFFVRFKKQGRGNLRQLLQGGTDTGAEWRLVHVAGREVAAVMTKSLAVERSISFSTWGWRELRLGSMVALALELVHRHRH